MQHRLIQQPILHIGIRNTGGIAYRGSATLCFLANITSQKTSAVVMHHQRSGCLGFRQPKVQYLPLLLSVRNQLVIRLLKFNRVLRLHLAKRSHEC